MAERSRNIMHQTLRASTLGFLAAAFFGIFVNAFQLIVPLYMLQIYDRVIVSHSMDTLVMLTVVALGCLVFLAAMDFIRSHVFLLIGERVARRLSGPTIRAALARALTAGTSGATQAYRDLHELRQFAASGPAALPLDAAFTPLFLLVLFFIHPVYGVVASVAALILLALSLAMEFLVRRPSQAANEHAVRVHAEVASAIQKAEAVQAMGMAEALGRRWQAAQDQALRMVGIGNAGSRALMAASRTIRMALQIAMLGTGAALVIDGQVSAGTIVAATIIMSRLLRPFEQAIEGWRGWVMAIGAWRRLSSLLDGQDAKDQGMRLALQTPRLEVDGLLYAPPGADRPILRNVTFALPSGEVLSVIGPSGAGKSTLIRMLVGLWAPNAGGVFLDGQNVAQWERASFGQSVGYLPQHASLLDGTIGENIARFRDATPEEIVAAARRVGAHEMIGRLPMGYETPLGEGGIVLSGGQQQRIALARAFFGRPKFIVLDEPNTHLDGAAEQDIQRLIAEARADGATVVVATHRPAMLQISDKLLVMRDGMVEFFGPPQTSNTVSTQPLLPAKGDGGKIARLPALEARNA